jgi:beta-lactamase regulating signal transducer with metallopeptidase domain
MSMILEFLNALSAAGLMAVLNTLWQALAVAAVMWFVLRLMPRVNAATRHAVWWAVLALVVLMPLTILLPRRALAPSPAVRTEKQIRTRAMPSAAKPLAVSGAYAPDPPLALAPLPALNSRPAAAPRARIPIELHMGNWPSSLLFLWIASCCILLGRIVHGYLRLRGVLQRARPASADLAVRFEQRLRDSRTSRAPQLLVSDEVISPLAAGFLQPVVILPQTLLAEIAEPELDYVLLHELAHVARRDDWTNLLGRLASAILVFHPVAVWVLRRIQREREIACDDWVVASTGSAVHYAFTLGHLAEFCSARRRELLATEMAHRSSNISERIEILLRPRRHFSTGASLPRVSFCAVAGLALLGLSVRMPGWIAFAKDATVAVAKNQAAPQSQGSAAHVVLAPQTPPIAAPALVATLSPAYAAQSSAASAGSLASQDKTWRHEWKLTRDSSSSKVQFSLISRDDFGNDRMNTESVPLSSLSGFSLSQLDHDGPVKFEYLRDSGRIVCEGSVAGGRASGPFTVVLDPSFVSALEKMGYSSPHDDEAFPLVTSDVTLSYARAVRDTGLTSSIADLVELRDHGVSSDYVRAVRQEGFTDLSASSISELRDHGVEPKYLKAIKADNPDLSIEAIDSLYDHGVKPDYYKSMKAAAPQLSIEQIDSLFDHGVEPNSYKGFASADPKLSIEEINSLRDHGVKPEYYLSMRSVDPHLSIEQIDSLFDHGVEPNSYKGFASADPKLSIEEINSLRDHGVKTEYYLSMRSVDPHLSIEQIDSLFDHGVEPDSYKGFASVDPKLSIEETNSLRDHGVKPQYYRNLKSVDSHLSIEQINNLCDHGVEPETYKGFAMVDSRLSVVQIASLHDHGVEPDFYKGTKAADSTVSIEEIDRLRDHGVDPEYLREIRALPDRFSTSDISELRDHGITAKYIRDLHDMGMKNLTAAQIVHLREGN